MTNTTNGWPGKPDQATALQKRVAELEGALDAAARVLHKAGEQFTAYANQHAAKGTAVSDLKAAANQQWAQRCFNAHDAALKGKKDE
jgi:prophage DNA circulation protein